MRLEPLLDRVERLERRAEAETGQYERLKREAERAPWEAEARDLRARVSAIPTLIKSTVAACVTDVCVADVCVGERTSRIEAEAERKLSARIGALERALSECPAAIEALRLRTAGTDACIQRLTSAIDRLCDRLPQASPRPAPSASSVTLPFEMQMSEAALRQTSEEPRVRVIKEGEPKRSRSPLARILPLPLLAVVSARFCRF